MTLDRSWGIPRTLFVFLLGSSRLAWPAIDTTRQARIEHLEGALLAPCCYREPVGHHQSEVAVKMRLEIRDWVNAGKTDEEILAAYEARYGAKVLAPPRRDAWIWSAGVPLLLMLLGGVGIVWLLSRWRKKPTIGPVSNAGPDLPLIPESEDDWDRFDGHAGPPPQSTDNLPCRRPRR